MNAPAGQHRAQKPFFIPPWWARSSAPWSSARKKKFSNYLFHVINHLQNHPPETP
jgi:hypothetical protein